MKANISYPAARSEGLIVERVGEESVVYDLESKEAHCLNPLAAVVFTHADGKSTTADIAELAGYRLGKPISEAEVAEAVDQLEAHALLDTPTVLGEGISRRQAVKRFAAVAGAATATPLIASVTAPVASAQGSLIPTGSCCGNSSTSTCAGQNPRCQSNHCCQALDNPAKSCNQCKCVGDRNDCSTDQCGQAPGNCPNVTINGVSTAACARTKVVGGKCCYPDANGVCCTVFPSGTGSVIVC